MIVKGKLYDGKHAGSREIRVKLGADGNLTAIPDGFETIHFSQIRISNRIGNTPRRLELPSGVLIETAENEKLDSWLAQQGIRKSRLHRLESSIHVAAAAVAAVAVIVIWFAVWGIPWLSTRTAYALPPEVNNYIGQGTLETLDLRVFKETGLEEDRRRQLDSRFSVLVPRDSAEIRYRLIFRGGGIIGANALALPDGTIILTDELVKLAKNDEEILAILLHEIGHVIYRHSLRQVISHSGLLVLTSVIIGDVGSAGSLVLALPNVLIDSSYSRDFETEADTYALEHLQDFGIQPGSFADFMERLERCGMVWAETGGKDDAGGTVDAQDCAEAADGAAGPEHNSWLNYISTHPPSAERIARFRQAMR